MKIRNGFVSNSSSSSFVVNKKTDTSWGNTLESILEKETEGSPFDYGSYGITLPIKKETYSFGWEEMRWYDTISKLNYATIQAMLSGKKMWEFLSKIERAIDMEFNKYHPKQWLHIHWDYNAVLYRGKTEWYAEIDHQSCLSENSCVMTENGEYPVVHDIFDSIENMRNFLFNPDAYIQGGNDNDGDRSDEYRESKEYLYGKIFNIHRDRDYKVYDVDDTGEPVKLAPLYEGTCKVCGSPVEYRSFEQDWYEIQDPSENEKHNHWKYIRDRVGVPHEMTDDSPWYDGYYICSNPECENHKKVFPVTNYTAKDAPILNRYEEFS